MVWAGLIIGLLSALIACYGDLKRPRIATGIWAFLRRNRLPMVSALLATAGFAVATLTVIVERREAARDATQLRRENDELKMVALLGRTVRPVIEVALETGAPLSFGESQEEEAAWNDGGSPGALPRPLGFIPSSVRALLFPGARPDPLMDILGKFDTRTARGDIRFAFHVLKDGTVRQSTTPLQIESFNTRIYEKDIPAVEFRITVRNMLNAIDVYQAVLGAYDDNTAPLVITGNVPTEGQECAAQMAKPRRGRLTVFLDDNRQFAVTALLREVPRECKKSPEEWRWMFAEPPKITLSGADSA